MSRNDHSGQNLDGRYRLIRLLGEGGMGAVYLGQHVMIGRKVAVKFLHSELAANEDVVKRFYREAQAAAAIRHKNIIDVLDVGLAPWGDPYLVMEYLEGEDLGGMLRRTGPLDLAAACGIMEPALNALAAVHAKGIVHRDLKPENIFLAHQPGQPPEVKLIDFGISKFSQGGDQTKLTQTGTMLGTPAYMSPEQAKGVTTVDHRADVYAMGVILYEMLTGALPFSGATYAALLSSLLTEPPRPPLDANPQFPVEAEAVVRRALSKDPADRQQNTQELLNDLGRLSEFGQRHERLTQFASTMMKTSFAGGDLGGDVTGTDTDQVAAEVFANVASGEGTPEAWSKSTTKKARRAWLLFGGIGAVLLAAVAALVFVFWGQKETTVDVGAGTNVDVEITLEDMPNEASIFYDGIRVTRNPFKVKRSKTIVPLRVTADGYEPFEVFVTPSEDQLVSARAKLSSETETPAGTTSPSAKEETPSVKSAETVASKTQEKDQPKKKKRGAGGLGGRRGRAPRIRSGAAMVKGSLSKNVIRRIVHRHIDEVKFCYEKQLAQRPDLSGRVAIKFIISGTGAVQMAAVASSTLGNAQVENCIAQAVRKWTFPQPEGGGIVIVTYPFMLTSPEG